MRRPVCLLQAAFTRPDWRAHAGVGGPMGEITVGRSLVRGLEALGYDAVELPGRGRLAARLLLARLRFRPARDLLVFDPWTLEQAARRRLVGPPDADRTLVVESFGTAPEMRLPASRWVEPRRFLTPFPVSYAWGSNTFLGFILGETAGAPLPDPEALLARVRAAAPVKERFGVLWTKEAAKIDDSVRALLAPLARICPIYATISPECGFRPGLLPPGVENLGHLPPAAWQALLNRASFLLGMGILCSASLPSRPLRPAALTSTPVLPRRGSSTANPLLKSVRSTRISKGSCLLSSILSTRPMSPLSKPPSKRASTAPLAASPLPAKRGNRSSKPSRRSPPRRIARGCTEFSSPSPERALHHDSPD